MGSNRLLLPVALALLLPFTPVRAESAGAGSQAGGTPPSTSELKAAIDHSLRWLRSQQDVETGAYGPVTVTSQVLSAFGTSPRHYRVADGPFIARAHAWLLSRQRVDGAIVDGDVEDPDLAAVQTGFAIFALGSIGEGASPTVTRARIFLGGASPRPPVKSPSLDAARDRASALLLERDPAGFWAQPFGPVHSTALRIGVLNRCHALFASLQPGAAQNEVRPLAVAPALGAADRARVLASFEHGAAFLVEASAGALWGMGDQADPGITAMVTAALLSTPEPRSEEVQAAIERGLSWLRDLQREDGSIHAGQLANYVTSAAVMALSKSGSAADRAAVEKARAFLVGLQADEGEGYSGADPYYGGVGYGGDERPDLSNLQMALEALDAAGLPEDDAAWRRALVFLQRCQNRSESNDLVLERDGVSFASGDDGGAGYAPGESKAGFIDLADGRKIPRSYGSMSYALLKGYLFAGLERDDPRVQSVWAWLTANYTLDVNPGFEASERESAAYQGLYYYFYTMARALDLYGVDEITDGAGGKHAWRAEMCGRIVGMQRPDGSWVNKNSPRWYEGNPVLASAYALLTLESTLSAPR